MVFDDELLAEPLGQPLTGQARGDVGGAAKTVPEFISYVKSNPGVLPDVPTVGDFVPGYEASALQGHWRAQGNARRDRRQAQHAAVMRAEAKLQRLLDRAVGWGNPDRPLFFDARNALDFMQLLAFAGVDRARKHAKTFEPLVDLHPRFFSSSCDLAQVLEMGVADTHG
jgi:hypothetical protein